MTDWTKLAGTGALALLLAAPAVAQDALDEDYAPWDADVDSLWDEEEFGLGLGLRDSYGAWDANQDGVIDRDEYNRAIMQGYDEDGDGMLNAAEQATFIQDERNDRYMMELINELDDEMVE